MAFVDPEDGYLTVVNLFESETQEAQDRLLAAMSEIIDGADFPGWISSTLHGGVERRGTANYIQWRSLEDLLARYAGEKFRHETVPLFHELSTSIRLLKSEVVFAQRGPGETGPIEITPMSDDYTVLMVMGVAPENQKALTDALAQPDEWLRSRPGYRSHSVLRVLDGDAVITYAQWASKKDYDAFHTLPEHERPADMQRTRAAARGLLTSRSSNTYRVVHSRSAAAQEI